MNTKTKKPFNYQEFRKHAKTPKYWGGFNSENNKHRYILSLLIQNGWTATHKVTGRPCADVERFGRWLQSKKSPVQKPLRKMTPIEVSKIITALEGMLV